MNSIKKNITIPGFVGSTVFLIVGLVFLIFCGTIATLRTRYFVDQELRGHQLDLSKAINASFNIEILKEFSGTLADYSNPNYLKFRKNLVNIGNTNKNIRYIYIMGKRNGKYFFYIDSEPTVFTGKPESKPLANPGEIYDDYPKELEHAYNLGETISVGPYTDKWGTFISAFVPVYDTNTKKLIAVSGIDMVVSDWTMIINKRQMLPIIISLLLIVLLILTHLYIKSKEKATYVLQNAHDNLELNVIKRTAELSLANENLKIEMNERLKAEEALLLKEKGLKQQNEEYLTLNEELLESHKRIQDINKELIISKEKAEESDRLKSAFLANVSHEIRTPMNGILGFTQLLESSELSKEESVSYLEIIRQSGLQLMNIINDVIHVSKIEAGEVKLNLSIINIKSFLHNVYSFFEPSIKLKNLKFSYDLDIKEQDNFIYSDETKLRQIIINLLSNALKFTSSGEIKFGCTKRNDFIEFFVKDTGIGIDVEHHKSIFERFSQVEIAPSKKFGGTGLGLSISKSLSELLGGIIRVESELNKGAAFFFTIPLKKPDQADIVSISHNTSSVSPDWHGKTILVADDEYVNYLFIQLILKDTKAVSLIARDGKEAIEMFDLHPEIDLVLMDIKMPEIDGLSVIKHIRKTRKNIPVVVQSAYVQNEDKANAFLAGCNDFISKPIDKEKLLALIGKHF